MYYMGALSDQILHLLWRPPYVFFHTKWGPSDHFFAYYIGAPRSLSSLTRLYRAPQISFFSYNMGAPLDQLHCLLYGPPLRSVSLHAIGGSPHILVFSQNIWGPPQISFSAYYMGPPQVSLFAYYIWGPLRSVSVHTFWGPLSDQFFLLL